MLVILADELDYLFTKNQQIIYKLFDWPNEKNSQLIVIVSFKPMMFNRESRIPSIFPNVS